MSMISSSPLSVCWRSGKATLSSRFIEPNSAPSWNRTPNFLRISNRSSSCMFGTDSPWTRTSPSSGYSRPTMCLMHTDLPVPDGPRIIEILPSGRPMFRPRRILLRPNALWTSTNSTASSAPCGRWAPGVPLVLVVVGRSDSLTTETRDWAAAARVGARRGRARRVGSSCGSRRGLALGGVSAIGRPDGRLARALGVAPRSSPRRLVVALALTRNARHRHPPIGARGFAPQNSWVPSMPMRCTRTMFKHHRLRGRGADADRAAAGVVAVVTADEHDGGGHRHALDARCTSRSGGFWNIQKIRKNPPLSRPRRSAGPPPGSWRRSRRRPRRCT